MDKVVKYYLLMISNPLSSSDIAINIYKMFRRLDILSREVTIFFPGFHQVVFENQENNNIENQIDKYIEFNQTNHSDYHGTSPIFYTYCDSVGDIYFNDADFARFIIDLENKTDRFEYDGKNYIILIPSHKGTILYNNIKPYNLDLLLCNEISCIQKVEEFIISLLKLIQKDSNRNSLKLINKIDDEYFEKLNFKQNEIISKKILIQLDDRILDHMKLKKSDEIIFISYSTKDEYHAFALKVLLENNKKQVWIAPDGIPDGSDYACAIPAALRISSRVVVLLSHNSANSTWVRREIGKAISDNKKVEAILLDNFTIDDLKKYDHLDFLFEGIQIKFSIADLFDNKKLLKNWLDLN